MYSCAEHAAGRHGGDTDAINAHRSMNSQYCAGSGRLKHGLINVKPAVQVGVISCLTKSRRSGVHRCHPLHPEHQPE